MDTKIKFGTDGWRSKIAENYTFDSVRRCSQGFATYLSGLSNEKNTVVVGYDKRFLSEEFACAASEVLAGNGFKVLLTSDATPTPVISFSVIDNNAIGAVNITASHNPPTDNGFKVRDDKGGAVAPDGLKIIENSIPSSLSDVKSIDFNVAEKLGKISTFDPYINYIEHIKKLVDLEPIKDYGFKIIVDAMWGNGAGWFTRLLGVGKTIIEEIHNHRNPIFPEMSRPEPIPPNIDVGLQRVVEKKI